MSAALRVTTRNARFQQWQALLKSRGKRQQRGEFLVQGVRPITLAVRHGWQIRALLYDPAAARSQWATELLDTAPGTRVAMAPELLRELGGRADGPPELLAVVGLAADDLRRIPAGPGLLAVVFDRPTSPGNIGTLVRSADAFGATGVVITGHAADVYDPKAVRASTGSLFSVPVVRVPSAPPVLDWARGAVPDSARGTVPDSARGTVLVGADEHGDAPIATVDLTGPTILVIGNETTGLSVAWRQACDRLARIPITGSASSLNAATAAAITLYEATRQRAA